MRCSNENYEYTIVLNVIKEKMIVTRSLLDDVMSKGWRRGDCQKGYWNGDHQGEGSEADPNLPGRRGL
jgi:hypothetical protein